MDLKREEYLKKKGFKREYFRDKSGYWLIKKFKLEEFNCYFYYDGKFSTIEIDVILDNNEKSTESIWKGDWKQFINKINKHERRILLGK